MTNPDDTTTRLTSGSALDDLDVGVAGMTGPNTHAVALLESLQQLAAAGSIQGVILFGTKIPEGVGFLVLGQFDITDALVAILETRDQMFGQHLGSEPEEPRTEIMMWPFEGLPAFDAEPKIVSEDLGKALEAIIASAKKGSMQGLVAIALRAKAPLAYFVQPAGYVMLKGTISSLTMAEMSIASQALVMMQEQQHSNQRIIVPGRG